MYVPGLLEDLKDIRATLTDALGRFATMRDGRAWDGDLTGAIDPAARAMILTSLEGKISDIDAWLVGEWSDAEAITLMDFVAHWQAELLTIERYQYRTPNVEPCSDLATIRLSGRPIPSLGIPRRGGKTEPPAAPGVIDMSVVDAAGGNPIPLAPPKNGPIDGPVMSD